MFKTQATKANVIPMLSNASLRIKAHNVSHEAEALEADIVRDMKREAKEKNQPAPMIKQGFSMGLLAHRVRIR